jgi:hypothetical protein
MRSVTSVQGASCLEPALPQAQPTPYTKAQARSQQPSARHNHRGGGLGLLLSRCYPRAAASSIFSFMRLSSVTAPSIKTHSALPLLSCMRRFQDLMASSLVRPLLLSSPTLIEMNTCFTVASSQGSASAGMEWCRALDLNQQLQPEDWRVPRYASPTGDRSIISGLRSHKQAARCANVSPAGPEAAPSLTSAGGLASTGYNDNGSDGVMFHEGGPAPASHTKVQRRA